MHSAQLSRVHFCFCRQNVLVSDQELRLQLEKRLRAEIQLAADEARAKADEAYWQEFTDRTLHFSDEIRADLEKNKDQLIATRPRTSEEATAEEIESKVNARVDQVLPFLIELRESRGNSGDVTDEEVYFASMQSSHESLKQSAQKLRAQAELTDNPEEKQVLLELARSIDASK